ncbi:hypothetical protein MAMC_01609 [Methylacidimicrobium cyclopophantes]|uniref:Uncharacterized protein n=1 Tax=Methylacidimicrobium cyclopophantes TaxID=1041766 RepID=A0A5E6MHT1_9BACT|nr:hypothetical protein [Methylacidimicrobium cyclopophantes]VVM07449.1 hypothetical protein MAMC_01609 [Methylacidimicrobium cyclopophantes]
MRKAGILFALLAACHLAGGHWLFWQGAAWAGMLVRYAQSYGMETGLTMTFDGKHPCQICKKVVKGKSKEEHSSRTERSQEDFGLFSLADATALTPLLLSPETPPVERPAVTIRTDRPLSPPPRHLA